MMNSLISLTVLLLALVGFVIAEYRTNYGVQNYTRLIDEFSIVAPGQQLRSVRMNFDYPGGLQARRYTLIRRIEHIDHNDKEARAEFHIREGGCDYDFIYFTLASQIGKGINSTIKFYGPMP